MMKLLAIIVLGLLWGGSVYSKDFIDSNIIIEKFLETEKIVIKINFKKSVFLN